MDISIILSPAPPVFDRFNVLIELTPGTRTPKEMPLMRPEDRSSSRVIELTAQWCQLHLKAPITCMHTCIVDLCGLQKYIHRDLQFSIIGIRNLNDNGIYFVDTRRCVVR